jgi:hypothetical protein
MNSRNILLVSYHLHPPRSRQREPAADVGQLPRESPCGFCLESGGATALAGGGRYGGRGYFVEPTRADQHRALCDAATIAFVISPVVVSDCRSGPRWLMALADCDAAEMLGAFDAGIE